MIDAQTLKRLDDLAAAIHGKGTTVEMLNRWAAFEAACKPELIRAMIAEITSLTPPAGQVSYREQMEAWKSASSQDLRARGELMIQVEELEAENEALRKIISESATACGAAVSVECSIEFMSMLPAEIGSVVEDARKDAERSKSMLLDACVQIGSIGEALGLDMDADADTMIGTARDLVDGLNRITKECPLGSPGFAIACEVLGELGVQQEVQP